MLGPRGQHHGCSTEEQTLARSADTSTTCCCFVPQQAVTKVCLLLSRAGIGKLLWLPEQVGFLVNLDPRVTVDNCDCYHLRESTHVKVVPLAPEANWHALKIETCCYPCHPIEYTNICRVVQHLLYATSTVKFQHRKVFGESVLYIRP